jgi:phosphate transport system permease protein
MDISGVPPKELASRAQRVRLRRIDWAASWIIKASGILIIGSVVAILLQIVGVALPLFFPPASERIRHFTPAWLPDPAAALAIGTDEYLETGYVLLRDGTLVFFDSRSGEVMERRALEPPAPGAAVVNVETHGRLVHGVQWSNGAVTLEQVVFRPLFDDKTDKGLRRIAHEVKRQAAIEPVPGAVSVVARATDDGGLTVAALLPANRLRVQRRTTKTDLLGNETHESRAFELKDPLPGQITTMTLDSNGSRLFAGTGNGYLLAWKLKDDGPVLSERLRAFADGQRVSSLAMVYGDTSLAVGAAEGQVSTWFEVPAEPGSNSRVLSEIHPLKPHRGAVLALLPSQASKTIVSQGEDGKVFFHYPANERDFLTIEPKPALTLAALSARASGLIGLDREGAIDLWEIDAPHPEFNLKAMFARIWYEGFQNPAFVWQSSAGTDDVEPKLSLMPLIFGTFKGTFYALLFAVPLSVLAAIYTSTLMEPRLRLIVKPTVEIMAAVPTVVIGFLAALWFAPLIEPHLAGIFLFVLTLPVVLVAFVMLWDRVGGTRLLKRWRSGYEFILIVPAVLLAGYLALAGGEWVQRAVFGGDFQLWMYQNLGTRVDQRNSVVIAFALGFAVIPIIFTISEDALIRVPRHLRAASLALGASRWQTAWRVLLPSASPGIFAAVMIGFGRAVGETMIVLMATGNTPIIDASIFNGMRTLSANIAVEIPEAPVNGTLYRVLFLSGVLLFAVTFVANTAAEVVRDRLRKKYGRV